MVRFITYKKKVYFIIKWAFLKGTGFSGVRLRFRPMRYFLKGKFVTILLGLLKSLVTG